MVMGQFDSPEVMAAPSLDLSRLWNADGYSQSGKRPWTIFADPASLADERHLPRDCESLRFLEAFLAAGARVGVWYLPANQTVYFACPFEEKERVRAIISDLEQRRMFPKNFARDHCEILFQSARTLISN